MKKTPKNWTPKKNSHNNAQAKRAAKTTTPGGAAATWAQSGVGKKTSEAFGVKPIQLL